MHLHKGLSIVMLFTAIVLAGGLTVACGDGGDDSTGDSAGGDGGGGDGVFPPGGSPGGGGRDGDGSASGGDGAGGDRDGEGEGGERPVENPPPDAFRIDAVEILSPVFETDTVGGHYNVTDELNYLLTQRVVSFQINKLFMIQSPDILWFPYEVIVRDGEKVGAEYTQLGEEKRVSLSGAEEAREFTTAGDESNDLTLVFQIDDEEGQALVFKKVVLTGRFGESNDAIENGTIKGYLCEKDANHYLLHDRTGAAIKYLGVAMGEADVRADYTHPDDGSDYSGQPCFSFSLSFTAESVRLKIEY